MPGCSGTSPPSFTRYECQCVINPAPAACPHPTTPFYTLPVQCLQATGVVALKLPFSVLCQLVARSSADQIIKALDMINDKIAQVKRAVLFTDSNQFLSEDRMNVVEPRHAKGAKSFAKR